MAAATLLIQLRPLLNLNNIALPAASRFYSTGKQREFVLTEIIGEKKNVALITLNRPKALNALNDPLMRDVSDALDEFENNPQIGTVILTGAGKAFAAGADIKQMKDQEFAGVYGGSFLSHWNRIAETKKPIIAAVNGYALGGGCEVAMMCDIIYASEEAKFGQPEILLGTIPGAGGTQRLIKAVGKSKAMEICLTGNQFTAKEAEQMGLVSKVVPAAQLMPEVLKVAEKIASLSKISVAMCKEAINNSFEMTLREGLHFERRIFHSTFATKDRAEGMAAFVEKRAPNFQDK